jgi:hypothetical protein
VATAARVEQAPAAGQPFGTVALNGRVVYRPFPRQAEFHASPARYRLFGGAAGPGKTTALLWEAIRQAYSAPGVDVLLLRRTFPELEQSLVREFLRSVPRALYADYNQTRHLVRFHNGSTLRFGYCRSEADVYQYQGAEYLFIGLDELTHFTLAQWQFLTSRNRCPVPGTRPSMAGASNPGNIGHAWVKALWVDRRPAPGMERPEQYDPADYAFIPARVWDNPIYASDRNYLKALEALPEPLRRAFLEGDWNIFAGQFFDCFDPGRHVVPAAELVLEPWWPRWLSVDWGFEHPAAALWHASDGERTVTYRERVVRHLAPRALAEELVALTGGERLAAVYLSPDAFAHRTSEASIAEQMAEVFRRAGLPEPTPADDDRVGGWLLLYQMLEAGLWRISDACPVLIETLPQMVRDARRPEDAAKREGDDAADAARYGLKSRLGAVELPRELRLAARVTATDPTIRALQARRALEEEQRPAVWRRWRRLAGTPSQQMR